MKIHGADTTVPIDKSRPIALAIRLEGYLSGKRYVI
jgi:hypothetical protein